MSKASSMNFFLHNLTYTTLSRRMGRHQRGTYWCPACQASTQPVARAGEIG